MKTPWLVTPLLSLAATWACSAEPNADPETALLAAGTGCHDNVPEYYDAASGEWVHCVYTSTPSPGSPPVDPCWYFPSLCYPSEPPDPCELHPDSCSGGGGGEPGGPPEIPPEFVPPTCSEEAGAPNACPDGQTCESGCKVCVPSGMLEAVNAARAEARTCIVKSDTGTTTKHFPATHALSYDCKLLGAAYQHATNMASTLRYGHVLDGRDPNDRAHLAGFLGNATENIAAGATSTAQVMAAWLGSDKGHCGHIMDPDVSVLAAALGTTTEGKLKTYWVQMFGYY